MAPGTRSPSSSRAVASLALVALVALAGCDENDEEGRERPTIAVSVPPQAWFVRQLAGDAARVEVLIPPGASPASYEPTMKQVEAVSDAAVYVKVGHPSFPFERAWLDRLLGEADGVRVVDCSEGVELDAGDPHVWTSVRVMEGVVPRLARALGEALPKQRSTIDGEAERLLRELDVLDRSIEERLAPLETRRFYVFHPAWGYFARDYNLEQVPIEQGAKEPGPHTLSRLVERARDDETQVIFVQPQFSKHAAGLVAGQIDAKVEELDPLAPEWKANLEHVASTLARALSR
jgi:zinc transport system substrate-binding protein